MMNSEERISERLENYATQDDIPGIISMLREDIDFSQYKNNIFFPLIEHNHTTLFTFCMFYYLQIVNENEEDKLNFLVKLIDRCCIKGRIEILEFLILNENVPEVMTENSFLNAVKIKDIEITELFLREYQYEQITIDKALVYASINGSIIIFNILLKYGANIHFNNGVCLTKASTYNHVELVKLLVQKGLKVSDNNFRPLKRAIKKQNFEVIDFFLHMDVDFPNNLLIDSLGFELSEPLIINIASRCETIEYIQNDEVKSKIKELYNILSKKNSPKDISVLILADLYKIPGFLLPKFSKIFTLLKQ